MSKHTIRHYTAVVRGDITPPTPRDAAWMKWQHRIANLRAYSRGEPDYAEQMAQAHAAWDAEMARFADDLNPTGAMQ